MAAIRAARVREAEVSELQSFPKHAGGERFTCHLDWFANGRKACDIVPSANATSPPCPAAQAMAYTTNTFKPWETQTTLERPDRVVVLLKYLLLATEH
ncbi:hypothetical protein LTR17_016777 [Elasticomyces elasticus]|nr:hypothetical protein LTR17_016777 [Elasticomyces elasticus]